MSHDSSMEKCRQQLRDRMVSFPDYGRGYKLLKKQFLKKQLQYPVRITQNQWGNLCFFQVKSFQRYNEWKMDKYFKMADEGPQERKTYPQEEGGPSSNEEMKSLHPHQEKSFFDRIIYHIKTAREVDGNFITGKIWVVEMITMSGRNLESSTTTTATAKK